MLIKESGSMCRKNRKGQILDKIYIIAEYKRILISKRVTQDLLRNVSQYI